jgi:hypothetical protein
MNSLKQYLIKNKDGISTVAGLTGSISGGVLFAAEIFKVAFPSVVSVVLVALAGVSAGVIGYLTGKNPKSVILKKTREAVK